MTITLRPLLSIHLQCKRNTLNGVKFYSETWKKDHYSFKTNMLAVLGWNYGCQVCDKT
jgi:hypothetical protein